MNSKRLLAKSLVAWIFLFSTTTYAQEIINFKTASKRFVIKAEVKESNVSSCDGNAKFSLFKTKARKPFQIIRLKNICGYYSNFSNQSAIVFDDFNFDAQEDIALRDGNNGSYLSASHQVYLFSKSAQKFVRNAAMTRLAQVNFDLFEADKKKKVLRTFNKSGSGIFWKEEYRINGSQLRKVSEINWYLSIQDQKFWDVKTKKLINGKWKTWWKRVKAD